MLVKGLASGLVPIRLPTTPAEAKIDDIMLDDLLGVVVGPVGELMTGPDQGGLAISRSRSGAAASRSQSRASRNSRSVRLPVAARSRRTSSTAHARM